jgi:hypothetical protein
MQAQDAFQLGNRLWKGVSRVGQVRSIPIGHPQDANSNKLPRHLNCLGIHRDPDRHQNATSLAIIALNIKCRIASHRPCFLC